jgi:hypothetical protein
MTQRTSITLWAGVCQQLSIRDNDHMAGNKRLGELNVRAFPKSLEISLTEIGGPPGGRQTSRSISMDVSPLALRDFLNKAYPL